MNEYIGRSTKQILEAKQNAVYVCRTSSDCSYLKELARELNRTDIKIVSVFWLTERKYMGLELTEIILDHSLKLNSEEYLYFTEARAYVRLEKFATPSRPFRFQ